MEALKDKVPQPKQTNNAALAIALHCAGVPWLKFQGVTMPGFNLYSRDFLKSMGCAGDIDTAIKDLFTRGIPGQIVYQFERTPESTVIAEVVDGWDNMANAIQKADSANPDATTGLPIPPTEYRQIGEIACLLSKARKDFFGDKQTTAIWRRRDAKGNLFIPAVRAIEGPSRTEREGDKIFYYGSMKLQSVKV